MSKEHLRPSQYDIDWALQVEQEVSEEDKPEYLDCLNDKPMSERTEPKEVRGGCILTGVFIRCSDNPSVYTKHEPTNNIEPKP